MNVRSTLWAVLPVALALAIAAVSVADDPPKKKINVETVLPVPAFEAKDVPSKVDREKKNFTVKLDDSIRIVTDPDADPDEEDYEKKYVKIQKATAEFDMVFIPGGEFQMGSPDGETGRDASEGPQHKVKVRDFWLMKYECSWDVFDLWYRSGNLPRRDEADGKFQSTKENKDKVLPPDAITRPTNPYVGDTYGHGREGKPALCMSHHAAMVFCHYLRLKTKLPFRLPTEAEWEYACRAGSTGPYGFDDSKEKLADYAWFKDNSPDADHDGGTTHKQGSKKPNAFGLYDMHGNLSEWTLDLFDKSLYSNRAKDPKTALNFKMPDATKWGHVVRGGSWADDAGLVRSSYRGITTPGDTYDIVGFRVARAP